MTDYRNNQCSQEFIHNNAFANSPEDKSRGLTALFAILFGYFGIHYFYLGKNTAGIITLLLSIVTSGIFYIFVLAQGIAMLCMDNIKFREKYVLNQSEFPLF